MSAESGIGLLTALGLSTKLTPREKAIQNLLENLSVAEEKRSHIISLGFQSESPDRAQMILERLVSHYLDLHIKVHQTQAPLQFFQDRSEELEAAMRQKEEALEQFHTKYSIASMDGQKTMLLSQVNAIKSSIDETGSVVEALRAKISSIKKSLANHSPSRELNRVTGKPNITTDALKNRLFELKAEEADLAARYHDSDRALIDLRQRIKQAESQLEQEEETYTEVTLGINTTYQALQLNLDTEQAQYQAQIARLEILKKQLSERQKELTALASREIELRRIERELEISNKEYREYRENLQRANISAALDASKISNISIVQPPSTPLKPLRPRKTLIMALGTLFALMGGVGLALLREYFDNTLRTTEDVEKNLGLPVLASISRKEFESCI
jgi:uncharacterized protein involved in exopolysaccharide biosynthesis